MIRMFKGHNPLFTKACELAKVQPTHRQWRRWENKQGSAHARIEDARRSLAPNKP